ncbi:MAG: efflux transporter outer membrane subunit [Rubrivivax sp.]|nr:efflux transporter outer membrane subunit [Rubrivivax sp.]
MNRAPSGIACGVLAIAMLAGCASLQTPGEAAPLPEPPAAWRAAVSVGGPGDSSPQALAAWWRRFADPTLGALVDDALRSATDVQAARARLRSARAARDLAAAGLRPNVGANASAQASRSEGRATTRQYRSGFDAAWEADLWGAGRAGVAAAEADVQAGAAALGQAQVAIAAEVAATLIDLRSLQARRATTEASLASQQHTLRITQWRAEAGLVTQLDVEQQRTTVAQTQAQLPALQAGIEQAMHALAVLTGRAPGELNSRLAAAAPLPEAPAGLALDIPARVLSQRPDVQAAEARVRAAVVRVDAVDARRLPSLQLSGSIGLSALSLSTLVPGTGVASLLAAVDWPVLDFGRLRAQVRGQEAALEEARVDHRATVLAALQEVEDTLVALRGAREQRASQQGAAESARRAARLAEQRYAAGLTDITSVLIAQRSLLAAEDALATTSAAVATQHVRLYKALGGGWTPTGEAATADPATAPTTTAASAAERGDRR